MDDILDLIKRRHDDEARRQRQRDEDACRRQTVAAACEAVAGWGPGSVVRLGGRDADEDDAAVQLAWAFRDLAASITRSGLADNVRKLNGGQDDPARSYALGLVDLAGQEWRREELEERVKRAWSCPVVWREIRCWIRRLPEELWPWPGNLPAPTTSPGEGRAAILKAEGTRTRSRATAEGQNIRTAEEMTPATRNEVEVLPLKEAADLLGLSLRKVYKMHQAGELQGPAGKPYRAYRRSVEELLQTPRIASEPASPAPVTQPDQPPPTTQGQKQPRRQKRSPQGFQFFELP